MKSYKVAKFDDDAELQASVNYIFKSHAKNFQDEKNFILVQHCEQYLNLNYDEVEIYVLKSSINIYLQ